MTVLYQLAREQLSKAPHYDFGLRALKAGLVMAGKIKSMSLKYSTWSSAMCRRRPRR